MNPRQKFTSVIVSRGAEIKKCSFLESLKMKQKMISNREADMLLIEGRMGRADGPLWTKTVVAYPAAGEAFGSAVVYKDRDGKRYKMDCTDFRGEKGIALVMEEYDVKYDPAEMVHLFVPRLSIMAVEGFPQATGWYETDETGMPCGKALMTSASIVQGLNRTERYLHRINGERVGPVARGHGDQYGEFGLRGFDINMRYSPSAKLSPPCLELKQDALGMRQVA